MDNIIDQLQKGTRPAPKDMETAFHTILEGEASDTQIKDFLTALHKIGESVEDITIGAQALRSKALAVAAPANAIDTCGTGGDGSGTYNISTAVALVVAAVGVPVAKHGNRALTSKSGSAEVLEALGVKLDLTPQDIEHCIAHANIGFMFAVNHHQAMRYVATARKELGFRTIFNLLGPLSNPSQVQYQLLGVFAKEWVEPFASVLQKLGSKKAWVVYGEDESGAGLDELTTTGTNHIAILEGDTISTRTLTPEDVGLPRATMTDLIGGDAKHNANAITQLLEGEASPYRDIVLLNAGAALCVASKVQDIKQGIDLAATLIDTKAAKTTLAKLVEASNHG